MNTTAEIIDDLHQGRMVIIMDDAGRENEGDLVMAAEKITPAAINFTVSIEAATGVTTGISATDRATTILAAVADQAQPHDLVQPGHIFPLMAQPGGVLVRAGHTEAGCDLARLAGLKSAAVIVEILNDDGSMARQSDLKIVARQHGLKIGTIADLIQYRIRNEQTVEAISHCDLPTQHGTFRLIAYQDQISNDIHLALVYGKLKTREPTLVRVHVQNTLSDLISGIFSDSWPLRDAMDYVAQAGSGVIVILRNYDTNRSIVEQIETHRLDRQAPGMTIARDQPGDLRTIGIGAQILTDLGVHQMRVMSAPKHLHALAGFDLEVTEFVTTHTP